MLKKCFYIGITGLFHIFLWEAKVEFSIACNLLVTQKVGKSVNIWEKQFSFRIQMRCVQESYEYRAVLESENISIFHIWGSICSVQLEEENKKIKVNTTAQYQILQIYQVYLFIVDQMAKKQCGAHTKILDNCISQHSLENAILQAWE